MDNLSESQRVSGHGLSVDSWGSVMVGDGGNEGLDSPCLVVDNEWKTALVDLARGGKQMAIVAFDPAEWNDANIVQVDSDAPNNSQAITEIEDWAAANGFARINESWLRQIFREGQKLFRGACYRLNEEERSSASAVCSTNTAALDNMRVTNHLPTKAD